MALWDSLTQLFQRDAEHRDRPVIPLDHISPAPTDTASLASGDGYFQFWVVQMFLKSDRDWFKAWYPVVQSLTRLRFGNVPVPVEIARVAGPDYLKNVDPNHLDRIVQVDLPLTPLVPFSGGNVDLEAGLIAMPGSDTLKSFLNVMGSFAGLLAVPQLSTVLNVANVVTKGVDQLLGLSNNKLVLGYQRTLEGAGGGGDNELKASYSAVIDAPAGTYPADQLWIKDSQLLSGRDLTSATPLTGVNYMLLRVETRRMRDDWASFGTISDPFNKAMDALTKLDANGNPNVADAEAFIRAAAVAALGSPDLTATDRIQVAKAIRTRYNDYKDALFAKGLEVPEPPTIAEVGALAPTMDPTPTTVGELFPMRP